ncbi:hypothetical protein X758_03540 [Mesorhizobium sp. LSHC416B00]|nr:hypothetical protein X758_03540 [Mesorhizobium sp. LSHC416B00]ESZ55592.1 hypothetical protein X728_28460 [Mesorhizobium sp. L103C120A0]
MKCILIILGVVGVLSSAASAKDNRQHIDPAYQKNINYLAGLSDAQLKLVVTWSANVIAVTTRCPALQLTPDGKSKITAIYILYDVQDKHLIPNPPEFKRAIRFYEGAYRTAAQRTDSCRAEKAKDPGSYR